MTAFRSQSFAKPTDDSHAPPRFPPRRRRLAGAPRRRLRLQRRTHPRPHAAGGGRGRRRPGLPRTVADRLHLRRPVPADRPATRRPGRPGTPAPGRRRACSAASPCVGLPLAVDDQVFNCAAVLHRGRLLGLVPKSFIPNYKEFYERRWFAAAATARSREVVVLGAHRALRRGSPVRRRRATA